MSWLRVRPVLKAQSLRISRAQQPAADAMGYDSLWVADHLFLGHEDAILEGWTTLAALAGATKQAKMAGMRLFMDEVAPTWR